jgi:nitroreductase
MVKGSEVRRADYPVDRLFLDRWSPRAMSGEELSEQELMVLFEAARWAPTSGNNQPWRVLYARRSSEHWPVFFDLLTEGNRRWTHKAAALLIFISKKTRDNGAPAITHSYDTGAAWVSLALQGALKGYVVHGMQGFDYERARVVLKIPEDYAVEAAAAVGRPGNVAELPEDLQKREVPSPRRPVKESVCEGPFCFD